MKKKQYHKVLFLNPPYRKGFSRASRFPSFTRSGTLYYPIWLSYAAGFLEAQGIEIEIIDAIADNLSAESLMLSIKSFQPDMVVSDIAFESLENDHLQISSLISTYPEPLYLLVGCHATAEPEEVLKSFKEDIIVLIGEFEQALLDLCRRRELKKIKGICFKDDTGRIFINKERDIVKNLDSIPFVSKVYSKYLNLEKYNYGITRFPVVSIFTARGCPYKCTFCLWPQTITGSRVRTRTPVNIADEFDFVRSELVHVKEIFVEDDTFNYSKQRVIDICNELISRGNKVPWTCNVRVDLSFEEMQLMKKAGCRMLVAGFESGDQNVLDQIKKGADLNQSVRFMQNAKRCKLMVHGCFIFGLPGETRESIQKTTDFSIKLDPDTAQYNLLFKLPGTGTYGRNDSIPDNDEADLKYARRRFYLRWKYLFKILFLFLRSPVQEGKRIIRVLLKFFKYFF